MSAVDIIERHGDLLVSSETIAEGSGVQHKNVLELINANHADFEDFGEVAFETRPGYNNAAVRLAMRVAFRREIVYELSDAGMSTRAIAPIVGVSKDTVHRDLAGVSRETPEPRPRENAFSAVTTLAAQETEWTIAADPATGEASEDEKGTHLLSTPGGTQSVAITCSRVERVRDFRRWVTRDVIPAMLGYSAMTRTLDDDEKGVHIVDTLEGDGLPRTAEGVQNPHPLGGRETLPP